jgi:hypothetical protein
MSCRKRNHSTPAKCLGNVPKNADVAEKNARAGDAVGAVVEDVAENAAIRPIKAVTGRKIVAILASPPRTNPKLITILMTNHLMPNSAKRAKLSARPKTVNLTIKNGEVGVVAEAGAAVEGGAASGKLKHRVPNPGKMKTTRTTPSIRSSIEFAPVTMRPKMIMNRMTLWT